jgi:hypothetical protein
MAVRGAKPHPRTGRRPGQPAAVCFVPRARTTSAWRRQPHALDRRETPRTSSHMRICEEPQPVDGFCGITKPRSERSTVGRERVAEQGSVGSQSTSIRVRVGDHRPAADEVGGPPAFRCDPGREPTIPIDLRDQSRWVSEIRLDLEDRKHSTLGVERQSVDDPTFPVDRKGDFGGRNPALCAGESLRQPLVQS